MPVKELYYIFAMVAELGDGLATPVDLYTATYILRLACMEVAQRVHMIAESPVASPTPNIIANMKFRLGKGGQKEGASAGSTPNPQL